jgi:membrane protease YdiL (CAAX protease family)
MQFFTTQKENYKRDTRSCIRSSMEDHSSNQAISKVEPEPSTHCECVYSTAGVLGIWLLWGVVTELLSRVEFGLFSESFDHLGYLASFVSGIITIGLVVRQKPKIFQFSSFHFRWSDLILGPAAGYVSLNLVLLIMKPPFAVVWPGYIYLLLLIPAPVVEELICRGVILRSLLHRMDVFAAILLASGLAAAFHLEFLTTFLGQSIVSIIYVVRRRSLAVSMLVHVSSNTFLLFPRLLITAHLRHML